MWVSLLGRGSFSAGILAREIGEELVDQRLEHDRRLGELDLTVLFEESFGAARTYPHILATEQALGLDAGVAVIRDTIER